MPVDINLVESPRWLALRFVSAYIHRGILEIPLQRWAPRPVSLPFAQCDLLPLRWSVRTAHTSNEPLGWVEICHPFHPLKGQRFPVLKTRRVSGIDTLILAHSERGSFSLNREWTDWGALPAEGNREASACYFDLDMLLELIALVERLTQLVRQMPVLETLLRGSLVERYKRCGKPGCKCAHTPGHGPKYYLSVSFSGRRPQMDYVPQAHYVDVTKRLANYHRVREIIEAICEINRELLRRREAF